MNFTAERLPKETFYPVYANWCVLHGFPMVNIDWLPENAFVCYTAEKEPIYCIWGWHSDSRVFWTGFPASNLAVPFENRASGLDFLLNFITEYAERTGYATVFTTSGTDAVISSLVSNGYIAGDIGINHYFKIL